ncbi:MAG: hypothetical protein A2Y78_10860 [Acidobacteria bacterium RBG_13_68_16]|nr:MAG: hypothetical protein A2Y78_10860 [Acidobacteria bacterium RBG_13_68_16]
MDSKHRWTVAVVAAALIVVPVLASAQMVTLPPSGKNQKASVSQWIGLVEVNVTYNAPKVTAPDGTDRTGKIWGQLVPYGMANLGFGTCGDQCPWRAGANENTVFRVSDDVKIEGQPLPAGSYGLHMIPGQEEWTIIFSKNSTSWGSFSYTAAEDALRVKVKPKKCEYNHWLTYDFTERLPDRATVALRWENLEIPWTITVDNANELYVAKLRQQLRNAPGFNSEGWQEAAKFCLDQKTNLKEALGWAQNAVSLPYIGQENFNTLQTLADLQAANGMAADADATMQKALEHPTARPIDLHQYGRQLLTAGEKDKALKVFELNAKKHPNAWPVNVGLARGYSAVGRTKDALKHAKLAVQQAPDELNKKNLQKMVEDLEAGRPVK